MVIIREIDDLGRIAIPKEIRRAMQLKEGEEYALNFTDGKIIIENANPLPLDDETIANKSNDRKTYIMRFEDRITDFIRLTEDQINLLKWLGNNDYLHDDVYYDECSEKEFKVI